MLAQVAAFGEGQEWLDDGAGKGNGKFAVFAMFARGTRHGITQKTGNAGKLVIGRKQELPALFIRQNILPEFGTETGKLFIDGRQTLLTVLLQLCAGAHETLPVPFENAFFLAGQGKRIARFPQRVDASEQRLVHADLGIVP
ncbi:hypothetical protein D3C87_1447020 [compost metagenome]